MTFCFRQSSILRWSNKSPFIILENFTITFIILFQPGPLFNQWNKQRENIAFSYKVMDNSNFELSNIIADILDNGNAHDKNTKLYFLYLRLEFLCRSSLQDFVYFFFSSFFFISTLSRLLLFFSLFGCFGELLSDFMIAIVYYLNKVLIAFLNCRIMEKHNL